MKEVLTDVFEIYTKRHALCYDFKCKRFFHSDRVNSQTFSHSFILIIEITHPLTFQKVCL